MDDKLKAGQDDHGSLEPIRLEDVWGVPAEVLPDPEQREHALYDAEKDKR